MVHDNVKAIRKARGIRQNRIAKQLGITPQGYKQIEDGKSRLDVERLRIIAGIIGAEFYQLFNDSEAQKLVNQINGVIDL